MSYKNDPRWIVTKFASVGKDGAAIPAGTRAFYYPSTKTLLTGESAEQASRDFEAARSDESGY
jgi:hypothetical protein